MSDIQFTNDSDLVWDIEITDSGDLIADPLGDLQLIRGKRHKARELAQQAYITVMTEIGDFLAFPELGTNLQTLIGMPQTPETGEIGKKMIEDALNKLQVFSDVKVDVNPVPTGHSSIRFDVFCEYGSRSQMILSIEQNLSEIL